MEFGASEGPFSIARFVHPAINSDTESRPGSCGTRILSIHRHLLGGEDNEDNGFMFMEVALSRAVVRA